MELNLAYYPKPFRGEFIRCPRPVEIGHRFGLNGGEWQVMWCQRAKPGWLCMAVRVADLPHKHLAVNSS